MKDSGQPLTREFFQEQGRRGGKLGGGKAIKRMSKAERSAYMRNLAAQRKNPGRRSNPANSDSDSIS